MASDEDFFRPVHLVQRAYRKIVRAFSFPGQEQDLGPEAVDQDLMDSVPPILFVVARMLLDAETTFACQDDTLAGLLELLTSAPRRRMEEADYLFASGEDDEFIEVLRLAKEGDLLNPHASATIVATARMGGTEPAWTLSGPGVSGERKSRFSLASGWLSIREERNREFPLGLDLILVSLDNKVLAIPRTTVVCPGGESWGT